MPLRYPTPAENADRYALTIGHLLDSSLVHARRQEIVYRDNVRHSYAELRDRIGRLASALTGLGAEQGMTIAMLDWDSHRYLEAYFAVPMMGAVLQTVNVRMPAEQIAYTLRHAEARILIVHRDFWPLIEPLLGDLPLVEAVVAIADGEAETPPAGWSGDYEALLAAGSPDFAFEPLDENAVATTFYTTGTTGDPKGVCFTHRQLVLHSLAACAPFGVTRARGLGVDDIYMPLTPMFHVHAWGVPYIATMLGLKQVYPGRYDPAMLCRLRTEHRVTYSHCVPTVLQMILDGAEEARCDLSGWMLIIGGAALPGPLRDRAVEAGMEVTVGYGMSETAPTVLKAPRDAASADDDDLQTRSGIPIPLVSVRIVDEGMHDVPPDGETRGELVLRAPWLTPCYIGDAGASETLWRGGWLHTQDVATIDAEGRVVIRDRLKDVIKSGGEWIDSIRLETLVEAVEGVAEAAVVGLPDPRWGERPCAYVVAQPGGSPSLAAINEPIERAIAAGALTRYARIGEMRLVAALPRTSVGKIDKKALRRLADEDARLPAGTSAP